MITMTMATTLVINGNDNGDCNSNDTASLTEYIDSGSPSLGDQQLSKDGSRGGVVAGPSKENNDDEGHADTLAGDGLLGCSLQSQAGRTGTSHVLQVLDVWTTADVG